MAQDYWQLGRWRRIPVALHWSALISCAWLFFFFWDLLATIIASAAFLTLLLVHEFGHVAALRWKRIPVLAIRLYGIHGETEHGYTSKANSIVVAWAGVAAQLVVLLLALAAAYSLGLAPNPIVSVIALPILFVFTKLNVFLIVVALLPIGRFDGHDAWAAIPHLRKAARRRRRQAREDKLFPEKNLTPERRQELEQSSALAASELIAKLSKKAEDRREDA